MPARPKWLALVRPSLKKKKKYLWTDTGPTLGLTSAQFLLDQFRPSQDGLSPYIWASPSHYILITLYNIILFIKKIQKHPFKFCDFPVYFSTNFDSYWFVFLYCKDINLVLKYPVFSKMLQKLYI